MAASSDAALQAHAAQQASDAQRLAQGLAAVQGDLAKATGRVEGVARALATATDEWQKQLGQARTESAQRATKARLRKRDSRETLMRGRESERGEWRWHVDEAREDRTGVVERPDPA